MFNVDDDLLSTVGYNVSLLSEEKKQQYKLDIIKELNKRASEQILARLSNCSKPTQLL